MALPPPEMAKSETILMRYIRQFHERLVERIADVTDRNLRATVWQLDTYLEKHKKFKDAEFIPALIKTLEYVVQKKSGSKWTLDGAKRSLWGRTRDVNQFASKRAPTRARRHIPIPRTLARALADQITKD